MKNFLKSTPLACAAIVLLAGCGGQSGAPGSMPQGVMSSGHAAHGGSWMKPGASGSDLLYISSPSTNAVYVFTYPGGQPVGTLTGFNYPTTLCSDSQGNVWIINAGSASGTNNSYLLEYAHGGTNPIATLDDSNKYPRACSVDATTGNLAVMDYQQNVAVYANRQGTPTYYSTSCCVGYVINGTYDGSGNLFFASTRWIHTGVGWLPKGASKVRYFRFNYRPSNDHGAFEWDGQYLAVIAFDVKLRPEVWVVVRFQRSGNKENMVGTVPLNGLSYASQFAVQGSGLVTANDNSGNVYFYNYPAGGNPTYTISGLDRPYGIAISVAPPGSRIHK
jgi:hypothetical protein